MTVCLSLTATAVHALSVGQIDVRSRLGEPLNAVVSLNFTDNETFSPSCVRVVSNNSPEDLVPGIPRARITAEPRPSGALLTIASGQPIEEPAVRLLLEIGCVSPLRREFVILLDPPLGQSSANPIAVPVTAPRRAETIVAQQQGRAARAAQDVEGESTRQFGASANVTAAGAPRVTHNSAKTSRSVANSANTAVRRASPRLGDRLSVLEGDGFVTRIQAETGLRVADMVDMTIRPELDDKARRALILARNRFAAIVSGEDPSTALAAREEEMQSRIKQFGSDITALRAELDMAAQRNKKLQTQTVPVWWWWITLAAGLMAGLGILWMAARYRQAKADSSPRPWLPAGVRNEPRSSSSEMPEVDSMAGGLSMDAPFTPTDYKVRVVAPAKTSEESNPPLFNKPMAKPFTNQNKKADKESKDTKDTKNTKTDRSKFFSGKKAAAQADEQADDGLNTLIQVEEHHDDDAMVKMFHSPASTSSEKDKDLNFENLSLTGGPTATTPFDPVPEIKPLVSSSTPLDINLDASDPFDASAVSTPLSLFSPEEEASAAFSRPLTNDVSTPVSTPANQDGAMALEGPNDLVKQWQAASHEDDGNQPLPSINSLAIDDQLTETQESSAARPADPFTAPATVPSAPPVNSPSTPAVMPPVEKRTEHVVESFDLDAALECQRVLREVLQRVEEAELGAQQSKGAEALNNLQTWLQGRNDLPPMPWLYALRLARQKADRAAYDSLANTFLSQFGRRVPSWDEVLELGDDRGMQARPELQEQVWQHWGTPKCIATVYNLLMDYNAGEDMFYNLALQRDLLNLANICPVEG